jgi:hypothetical protein
MSWIVKGNELKMTKKVDFVFPIKEVLEMDKGVLVVLNVPADESMTENVYFVDNNAEIKWQIAPSLATSRDPVNRYIGALEISPSRLLISNWNGIAVEVDAEIGAVIGWRETK